VRCGTGIAHAFLRPNLFFQGLLAFAGPVAGEHRFYAPIGSATVSAVDVRDIAGVAAIALTGLPPGRSGQHNDLPCGSRPGANGE
jgi:uncharacterized protein YbjT (DUF2867 family)